VRPAWSISADGQDLTEALAERLLSLRVTDKSGLESDTLDLRIADPRGELAMPALNATLEVSLGYQGAGLVRMGAFVVDALELANPPRVLSIQAHGADLTASLRDRRTEGHEDTTVGEVAQTIAQRHGLAAAVSPALAERTLARVDQTNESDIGFLTRLGRWFDALVAIKAGRLLITQRGQGVSVDGQALGVVACAESDVLSWRYQHDQSDTPATVEARTYDPDTATDTRVSAAVSGEDGGSKVTLRESFRDPALAQTAATSYATSAQRNSRTLSMLLPGRPAMAAETPLALTGFHTDIDGRWIVTTATHRIDQGGYLTEVEATPETAAAQPLPSVSVG
jgi:phage protein D